MDADLDHYEYTPKPPRATIPPITPHEFETSLSFCNPCCKLSFFHDCLGPPIGTTAVQRIPKKKSLLQWEANSVETAWGIQARHVISFLHVLIYHALILGGTFGFWAWWQWRNPNDLQNAAIPLTTVCVLLSLFWSSAGALKILRDPV